MRFLRRSGPSQGPLLSDKGLLQRAEANPRDWLPAALNRAVASECGVQQRWADGKCGMLRGGAAMRMKVLNLHMRRCIVSVMLYLGSKLK